MRHIDFFFFFFKSTSFFFFSHFVSLLLQENSDATKAFVDGRAHRPMSSPAQKAPGEGLEEGSHLQGEDGPSTKDLREWLRQHPTYTMDVPGYVPVSAILCAHPTVLFCWLMWECPVLYAVYLRVLLFLSFRRMRTSSSPSLPSPNRKGTDAAIPTR